MTHTLNIFHIQVTELVLYTHPALIKLYVMCCGINNTINNREGEQMVGELCGVIHKLMKFH